MNKKLAVAALLQAFVSHFVCAQSAEILKPSEPVLKRAPANAEWTIDIYENREKAREAIEKNGLDASEGNASEVPRALPKAVTISKNGSTYREITLWGDGRKSEKWIVGNLQVYETPFSGQIVRSSSPYADDYSDYRRSDFEGLEWVNKDNFQGIKDVKGRRVFEFRVDAAKRRLNAREVSIQADPDSSKPLAGVAKKSDGLAVGNSTIYTAYLDIQTQLPLYFDDGQTVRIYKFSERPSASLAIPDRFVLELENWKRNLNRRRQLPKP